VADETVNTEAKSVTFRVDRNAVAALTELYRYDETLHR